MTSVIFIHLDQPLANHSSDCPCGPVHAFRLAIDRQEEFSARRGVGTRAAMSGKTAGTSFLIQTARDR